MADPAGGWRGRSARRSCARALACLLLAALAVSFGCGGGGGGGPPTPTTPTGPQSVALDAAVAVDGVSLRPGAGTGGLRLEVEVRVDNVSGVFGMAFDLVFPSGLLEYSGFSEGSFLGIDGASTAVQVSDTGQGRLIVGATRLGRVGAVSGSGVVLTLVFQATAFGSGALDLRGERGRRWGGGGGDSGLERRYCAGLLSARVRGARPP